MKKIMCLMVCLALANTSKAQDLHVNAGGSVTIKPAAFVFAGSNVKVQGTGTLTAESDATNSSSLIAMESTATGKITYKRYVDTDWHLITAPVTDQNINDFATAQENTGTGNEPIMEKNSNRYALGWYNNTLAVGSKWVYYTTPSEGGFTLNFISGLGYSAKRARDGVLTFTGEMNIELSATVPFGGGGANWTVVGNPFPSFLPATANGPNASILEVNKDLLQEDHAALYIWNDSNSGYSPYNLATPGIQLPPGQGFIVKGKAGAAVNFTFPENLQAPQSGSSDNFQRTAPIPTVIVNLASGAKTAQTIFKYFSNTTDGLDIAYDGAAYAASNFSINSHLIQDSSGVDMYIQCLSNSDYENKVISLAVNAAVNETIKFSAEATDLPAGINIYLEDTLLNTVEKINDASHELTLSVASQGIGRFYLRTGSSVLGTEDNNFSNSLNLYKRDNNTIRITGFNEVNTTALTMYTVTGKEVFTDNFASQRVNDVVIPNLASGIYLVQVISNKGKFTKKLIIE